MQDGLVSVPGRLFEGSLLLGGAAQAVLGSQALQQPNILIHPTLIAGWCGLVTTALNCLPVGSLDGGRMTQVCLSFSTPLFFIGCLLSYAGPFGLFDHPLPKARLAMTENFAWISVQALDKLPDLGGYDGHDCIVYTTRDPLERPPPPPHPPHTPPHTFWCTRTSLE